MPDRAVRRRVLSQNFLVDHRAIDALVDGSGAGHGDLVLDIGAGNGLISAALARRGAQVQAIERDPALVARLRAKFAAGRRSPWWKLTCWRCRCRPNRFAW